MNLKKGLLLATATLSILVLTACGRDSADQGDQEQTLRLMQDGEIMSLDHSNEANINNGMFWKIQWKVFIGQIIRAIQCQL